MVTAHAAPPPGVRVIPVRVPRAEAPPWRGRTGYLAVLMAAICFEGQARKWFPLVPSVAFYFLKDVVLLVGLLYGIHPAVMATLTRTFRTLGVLVGMAFLFTVLQLLNPEHQSFPLGLLGIRSYWLWWAAPLVVASALRTERDLQRFVWVLALVSAVVSGMAIWQFAQPADADANLYAMYAGQVRNETATVASTGRARVASTFSYITGFTDFVVVVPLVLLTVGMDARGGPVRAASLAGFLVAAISMPTSGSRGPVVLGGMAAAMIAWQGGLFLTQVGRRALVVGGLALAGAVVLMPEAVAGLTERFEGDDTSSRFQESLRLLPPVALAELNYPALGIGTGMQHNARDVFGVTSEWSAESETERTLVELGVPGYLLVWLARLALVVALLRMAWSLRRRGRKAASGLGWVLAYLGLAGALVTDHVMQALFFTSLGMVMALDTWPALGAAPAAPPERVSRLPGRPALRR